MTDLEPLIFPKADTAADKVAVLADIEGLLDVIKSRKDDVRESLTLQVKALGQASGGQFTLRCDAGQAYIAGGNLKPKVTDVDALAEWANARPDLTEKVTTVRRVEVENHDAVADALGALDHVEACEHLRVVREWRIADDLLDTVVDLPNALVADDGVHVADPETGETSPVPGIDVTTTRESLTVKPDKKVRAKTAAAIEAALNRPAELAG